MTLTDISTAAPAPRPAKLPDLSAREIVRSISAGDLSSSETVEHFIARLHVVNGKLNAVAVDIRWRGGAARRRISFLHLPWPPSYGVDVTAGGLHRQGDGSRTCARSEIPGWHDRALYPLAGRRRAPPDFFLAFAMAAELRGRRHRRRLAPAR